MQITQSALTKNADAVPTMADLVSYVLADEDLTDIRRRNLASSIRRFCAALGCAPEQSLATFWFFREALRYFAPSQAGLKPHRWQTIKSDVTAALKRFGQSPDQVTPRAKLGGDWVELRSRLSAAGYRWGLLRLARFCESRGILPSNVDDAVIDGYIAAIRNQTFKANPQRHHREICRLWNRIGDLCPELQLKSVSLPSSRQAYTPKWEALSPAFHAEAEAWLRAMSEECDILSETGPTRPLRPATIRAYRFVLRQAVAGLHRSGRPLETITSLAALVQADAAAAILKFYLDRNGNKASEMLAKIAHVLVLVAEHAVRVDAASLARLKRYRANLAPRSGGLRPKPQRALRQFVDRANIEKLLVLPQKIRRRLERKDDHTLADARLMQVAVALELLLMRPIRRSNLVGLRLGLHVIRTGSKLVIVIDEAEVKNRVGHDYALPTEATCLIDFYVNRLLPLFGDNPERFLFPGEVSGRPKTGEQFGRFFRKTIRDETGLEIYPHLLRHFAATLYLTENPDGIEVVRRVLAHRTADTTRRRYAGVHDAVAVRRFDELVLGIRGSILNEIGRD
jgi:site-specific recombinase XerD